MKKSKLDNWLIIGFSIQSWRALNAVQCSWFVVIPIRERDKWNV